MKEIKICKNCEYFDNGDCLNSWSSPRFTTTPENTCKGFYPNTGDEELLKKHFPEIYLEVLEND